MSSYKRVKRVRPVLIRQPIPKSCKKYERYYVGINSQRQYVFEFPNSELSVKFLDEVGGAPLFGNSVVLAVDENLSPTPVVESTHECLGLLNRLRGDLALFRSELVDAYMPVSRAVSIYRRLDAAEDTAQLLSKKLLGE